MSFSAATEGNRTEVEEGILIRMDSMESNLEEEDDNMQGWDRQWDISTVLGCVWIRKSDLVLARGSDVKSRY
jgi:hypothetical protein